MIYSSKNAGKKDLRKILFLIVVFLHEKQFTRFHSRTIDYIKNLWLYVFFEDKKRLEITISFTAIYKL